MHLAQGELLSNLCKDTMGAEALSIPTSKSLESLGQGWGQSPWEPRPLCVPSITLTIQGPAGQLAQLRLQSEVAGGVAGAHQHHGGSHLLRQPAPLPRAQGAGLAAAGIRLHHHG